MSLNSAKSSNSSRLSEWQGEGPRLDYSVLEPKYWYKYHADNKRPGKKCVFKDIPIPKPIYTMGHSNCRRMEQTFIPVKSVLVLSQTNDIASKVQQKIQFGEVKPTFMVGPSKCGQSFLRQPNTFDNLFGGSVEPPENPQQPEAWAPPTNPNKLLHDESSDERVSLRTGLKIVSSPNKAESDYWLTTFRNQYVNNSDLVCDEKEPKTARESSSSPIQHADNDSVNEERSLESDSVCEGPKNSADKRRLGGKTSERSKKTLELLMAQLEDTSERTDPSGLPIHLQGLKRSENDWYRRIRSSHLCSELKTT